MSPNRTALVLLAVGLVLLPGPTYAGLLADVGGDERHRSATGYVAEPIDAANDSALADRYADRVSFHPESLTYRHVADEHRAPNRTRETLERAVRNGTASATDGAVRSDLRRITADHSFLTLDYESYHAFSVSGERVRTETANAADVAATVRDELMVDYRDLPPAERETFRKVRNATASEGAYDYRPWSDEALPDEPVVERNGTHYAVSGASVTDDFGTPGLLAGFAATVVGAGLVVGSAGLWLYGRLRG